MAPPDVMRLCNVFGELQTVHGLQVAVAQVSTLANGTGMRTPTTVQVRLYLEVLWTLRGSRMYS